MNNIAYTKEARIRMIEDVLLPLGYERDDTEGKECKWTKYYDEEFDFSPIMSITIYLGANLELYTDYLISQLDEYDQDPNDPDANDVDDFVNLVQQAHKQVLSDLNKVKKHIEETLETNGLSDDERIRVCTLKKKVEETDEGDGCINRNIIRLKKYTGKDTYYEIEVDHYWTDQVNDEQFCYSLGHYKTLEEAKRAFNR